MKRGKREESINDAIVVWFSVFLTNFNEAKNVNLHFMLHYILLHNTYYI